MNKNNTTIDNIHEDIQDYYGIELKGSQDLKTNACCTITPPKGRIREALDLIAEEVKNKYYGCGLTLPSVVKGLDILDLGSGSGRDCYIASYLAGEQGSVTGVDMTSEQLEIANKYKDHHREKFGFTRSNVRFLQGNIEELDKLDFENESFDVIISNCVINLTQDKQKVLRDAFALLKTGGELYFSDIYCDRRVPDNLKDHRELWNECLSGALYWNDFLNMAKLAGFTDPRWVENEPITIENPELQELTGDLQFFSVTYRLIKLDGLESDCENYGQAICYKGGIHGEDSGFTLDHHHYFPKGKIIPVCGNSYRMLNETRFNQYFEFYGSWDTHYGIFEGCGGNMPFSSELTSSSSSCC